ncbi:DUF4214 domain-containing protein [Marinobacter sp. ANT_B65]|uniref:DUF4214 domain-containing protein n=1 Tax=Marinobacter sp. ANT_B65 TaxID=2039467 RepID=UPI000BBEE328|nr:DUF4214 domain-containing protein [Marinobacter sp. ANT_B65]PCM44571.1 hypothetical protein CPA50_00515 [Marinobacter sp. ANT_B65]
MSNYYLNRRKFLQGSAVLGAGLLAPAIFSSAASATSPCDRGDVTYRKLITAIGESTFRGYLGGTDYPWCYDKSIPQQVEDAVRAKGLNYSVDNRAISSTKVICHVAPGAAGSDEVLAETNTNIVILNFGINDAVYGTVDEFKSKFCELIENCKKAGKRVVVTHPNKIKMDDPDDRWIEETLTEISAAITTICQNKNVELVTDGLVYVELDDQFHPVAGAEGYIKAGKKLVDHVSTIAPVVARQARIVGAYVALFGRTAEKGGLDYWESRLANEDQDELLTEMANYLPDYTPSAFVKTVYQNLFGRSADQGGLNFWSKVITDNPQSGKGQMLNGIIDTMQNGTSSRQSDIDTYRHRVHCGMAYGAVYGITDVASDHNLAVVNNTWQSVRAYTESLF